jgi:hypothetical protein
MAPQRKRKQEDRIEELEELLDKVLKMAQQAGAQGIVQTLRNRPQDVKTVAAADFTLQQSITAFRLKYNDKLSFSNLSVWKIEDLPETQGFTPTPCIRKIV